MAVVTYYEINDNAFVPFYAPFFLGDLVNQTIDIFSPEGLPEYILPEIYGFSNNVTV